MPRVLVITNNLKQASFRLRVAALLEPLAKRGFDLKIEVRPRSLLARRRLMRTARQFDAVLLQRKLLDPGDLRVLRSSAKRIVYDVDDAVMFHERRVGRFEQWRTTRRFHATARSVDHVVAGNEYLAEFFRREGCRVTVLPTVVDPQHYRVKSHAESTSPRLVWIGSHSTLPYLRPFLHAIAEAARRATGLGLITIADETISNAPLPVEHVRWSVEAEADALVRGDIGIAPTPTDRWTLGKCGFKIIQYMAAGLPVIASPVGANAEIVREGETGRLVESIDAWTNAIVELARDVETRRRLGAAGRARVEREYTLDRAAEVWAKLLSGEI
jgi:glycosyltransferase involved in cell wall biosynthesis